MKNILVIGYGNELRGDDAAGPKTAAALSQWRLSGVRVLIRHQLTPELAEDIAGADTVVFVDAARPELGEAVRVLRVDGTGENPKSETRNPKEIRKPKSERDAQPNAPAAASGHGLFSMTHAASPAGLVALARDLYGHRPAGWIVSIPGRNFALGEGLSAQAEQGVAEALLRIRELCEAVGSGAGC